MLHPNFFADKDFSMLVIELNCSELKNNTAINALIKVQDLMKKLNFPHRIDKSTEKLKVVLLKGSGTKENPQPGIYQPKNKQMVGLYFRNKDLYDAYIDFLIAVDSFDNGHCIPLDTMQVVLHSKANINILKDPKEVKMDQQKRSPPISKLPTDTAEKKLLDRVDAYIARIIKPRKEDAFKSIDFAHNFIFFVKSRSVNRELNYGIAIALKHQLESKKSISEIFTQDNMERIIKECCDDMTPKIPNHVIRSTELNKIIKTGEDLMNGINPVHFCCL